MIAWRPAHAGKARSAASIAARQSARPPNGTVRTTSSVPGLITSQVPPFKAPVHSPSISC